MKQPDQTHAYKTAESTTINLQKGKIPPQAIELEQSVLGALLIDSRSALEVIDVLFPEAFYKSNHKNIYKSIAYLFRNNEPIDILTVCEQLKKQKKLDESGGEFYIIELTQYVSSSAHIEFHSRIILQKYIQRKLIETSSRIIENCYADDADVFDLLDHSYNSLNNITESTVKQQETPFRVIINSVIERGVKIYNKEIKPGIATPIERLTRKAGGWRNSELIILAARPGMGKTSFALTTALCAGKAGMPVAFFSLEMSKEQLTSRIISMEAKIDNQKFVVHGLNKDDESKSQQIKRQFKTLPFFIDDTASLSIEQFQVKAKVLKSKHDIKLIIVDYLQLMTANKSQKGGNREQEISKISRGLKKVAKELDVPIIALSQLSRAVETRGGNKRPLLSDLRESGAIEQDADIVTFLYRPEYYGIDTWDDYSNESTSGEAEYIVSKNRNGALVRNRMKFEAKYTLFSDLEASDTFNQSPIPPSALPSYNDTNDIPF